jgi:hypothetical protein
LIVLKPTQFFYRMRCGVPPVIISYFFGLEKCVNLVQRFTAE